MHTTTFAVSYSSKRETTTTISGFSVCREKEKKQYKAPESPFEVDKASPTACLASPILRGLSLQLNSATVTE